MPRPADFRAEPPRPERFWPGHSRAGGPPRGVGLWAPVIVSFLFQVVPVLIPIQFWAGDHRTQGREWLVAILIMLIGPIALIGARRFPGPVVAIVAIAAAVALLLGDGNLPPYFALGFAIVSSIVRGARIWAWVSVGAVWALTLWFILTVGSAWNPFRIAVVTLAILIVFGIGEGMRTRREHFQNYQRAFSQRRETELQAERVRIARELHDVLAHSLSQINVQAGVGLHLLDSQPDKAGEALASIKQTSKGALDEVRSVLGALRSEVGVDPNAPLVPEPDLDRLPGLAASVTQQGVAVTLTNTISALPSAAIQLAIYRIVQESLTNVVRHARATRSSVEVSEAHGEYLVRVTDDGEGAPGASGNATGRGLLGMRERAELLGGTFSAGPASPGFEVEARIPVTQAAP